MSDDNNIRVADVGVTMRCEKEYRSIEKDDDKASGKSSFRFWTW